MGPWYNIFLVKFIVSQLLETFYDFTIPENLSQNSEKPSVVLYSEPAEANPHIQTILLQLHYAVREWLLAAGPRVRPR
jgi:hypothetical protein